MKILVCGAGPQELVEALGRERVMIGFPMAAGYRQGHEIHYLVGARPGERALIPIGEGDGRITLRTEAVGSVLASMPGFGVDLRSDAVRGSGMALGLLTRGRSMRWH